MGPRVDADTVRGFVEHFLWPRFSEAVAISPLHMAMWRLACSDERYVAFAVPREHSKTTSLPKARGLCTALYRQHPFQLKVGSTHDLALEIIRWCKDELNENEKLQAVFRPKIVQDQVDDLIVELPDGYRFRWVAMGMNQAKRGYAWGTMRPSLVDIDDAEIDKEVLNKEIREETKRTLRRVILPMGGDNTEYRIYGTILHQDSMLASTLRNPSWRTALFEACDEHISPESILWPEKFPVARLRALKSLYIRDGDLSGFNMEYRNIAVDAETAFFRPEDFRKMDEVDHTRKKTFYVGGDLAFSKKEKRDYSVFVVGGVDEEGILHIVDERRGRWDGKEVIDEMYSIHAAWEPEEWFIESGAIKETLGAALEIRMRSEGYLNICPGLVPTKDKATRAWPLQARMRGRGVRFDTETSWFPDYKQEMLEFAQEGTRGAHDDRVDASAWLAQGLKRMTSPLTEDEEEDAADRWARRKVEEVMAMGRSETTGY